MKPTTQQNAVIMSREEIDHKMEGYGLNPCGEIEGKDFHCNLSEIHLAVIDPFSIETQIKAFQAGSLSVAALLHQKFDVPKMQRSRELDPIVGVSFTGLFDFFVHAFGVDWLKWWQADRVDNFGQEIRLGFLDREFGDLFDALTYFGVSAEFPWDREVSYDGFIFQGEAFRFIEQCYLTLWKVVVKEQILKYCSKHGLKIPNRYTTVQPAGTKSLLTGSSPGWHPPKATRYIRRITYRRDHPVCLAAMMAGYKIVPSQSCTDETGRLLNDPFDERVFEWLLEMPFEVSWARLPGVEEIDVSRFSVTAQWDMYMQVQKYYTTHNTSATLELAESEIEDLGHLIYKAIQNDEGYISAALLARFHDYQSFPRLPFEPIDRDTYDRLIAEVEANKEIESFQEALQLFSEAWVDDDDETEFACTSDKCEIDFSKLKKDDSKPGLFDPVTH